MYRNKRSEAVAVLSTALCLLIVVITLPMVRLLYV